MNSQKRMFACLFALLLAWAMQGCVGSTGKAPEEVPVLIIEGVTQPPEGKFFFVEFWVEKEGTQTMIDFPTYNFDLETKTLETYNSKEHFPFELTDWGFFGKGTSDQGIASGLMVIDSLPHNTTLAIFTGEVTQYGGAKMVELPIELLAFSSDGSLELKIDGKTSVLESGKKWEHTAETDVTLEGVTYHHRVTSLITNYGWLERSQFQYRP